MQRLEWNYPLTEQIVEHLPARSAAAALFRCALRALWLIATGRLHQPVTHRGERIQFSGGTSSTVYRETTVDRPAPTAPVVLIVAFRLRHVRRSWAHALFRWESELNTLLFAGFPGLLSKLWLTQDQQGRYRGVYQWDGTELATNYVKALWWALALVSEPDSIRYSVIPGLDRDDYLAAAREGEPTS